MPPAPGRLLVVNCGLSTRDRGNLIASYHAIRNGRKSRRIRCVRQIGVIGLSIRRGLWQVDVIIIYIPLFYAKHCLSYFTLGTVCIGVKKKPGNLNMFILVLGIRYHDDFLE